MRFGLVPLCLSVPLAILASSSAYGQSSQLIAPTDPLPPQQQREMFHLPPGFEIQLIVAEDDIGQPMNLKFDASGRLWITSSVTYPYPTEGEGVEPRDERFGPAEKPPARDWVTVVEGIGPDGTPANVWRFAEGLNLPIGILPIRDGAIIYDIPAITLRRDTDGDGRADQSRRLMWGFGNVDTHGMNNAFTRWIDGWIYACHGFRNTSHVEAIDGRTLEMNSGNTYRFREDGAGLEQFTWGQVNPYGLTFDPLGNLYSADCHSMPLTLLLRGAYYPSFGKPHDGLGFGPNMIDHLHGSTGICGPAYYAAMQFPEEYRDNLYLCNPVTGRVHRDKLIDHGSTRLVDTQPDFITCDDGWFRPVDLQVGPDGCLYVADFYNAIIGHYEVELKHPRRDRHRGRVWRVVYRGEDGSIEPPPIPDLTVLTLDDLVEKLGDPNLVIRTLATNELIDRFGPSAAPAVEAVLSSQSSPEHRVHAMWVLERLGRLSTGQIVGLSQVGRSPLNNRLVRTHVARLIAERPDWTSNEQLTATLRLLAADDDGFVQRAAVEALGRQPRQDSVRLLLGVLESAPAEDTHLRHAARIALRNHLSSEAVDLAELLASTSAGELRELMSVSLAVRTNRIAAFLASATGRCDGSPDELLRSARHVARFGTPADIRAIVTTLESRFRDDASQQHELLLAVREGLQQRGESPGEFIIQWATDQARRWLQPQPERTLSWCSLSLSGAATPDQPWTVERRRCDDGQLADFFSTLPRGEQVTGVHRSSSIVVPERLSFFMAGHCGGPQRDCHGRNRVRLIDEETGLVLAEALPPRDDVAREVTWDLKEHAGRLGYLELEDGDGARAYAWLAVGRFSLAELNPTAFSPLDAAVEVIASYQLQDLSGELTAILNDAEAPLNRRTAAARALVSLKPDARLQTLIPYVSDPRIDDDVQHNILAAVDSRDPQTIETALAAVSQSLPAHQQEALAIALAADEQGGDALLRIIERGKASRQLLLAEPVKRQLAAARIPDIDRRLAELTSGLPSADEQIARRIAQHRESFDIHAASPERGRAVFEKNCANCHRIGDKGAVIGPQVDGVGVRGVDRILEDLLDPNRNVDGAFRITTLLLTDGRVLTGLFRRQEGETLVFADQKGQEFTVQSADIEEQSLASVSLMPTNLYDLVQPEQINDLLAYLLEQRATTPASTSSDASRRSP